MELSKFVTDIILAPLIAFLIPLMWKLASILITWGQERFMQSNCLVEVNLNLNLDYKIFENAKFKCLLIRFGTDQYIKDMASDKEKYDGRLRNQIIDGFFENGKVQYSIPLHQRIGTQFKCYLEVKTEEETKAIINNKDYKEIYDLSLSCSKDKNRVFFLLKDYGTAKTIDGFQNNMIFPI